MSNFYDYQYLPPGFVPQPSMPAGSAPLVPDPRPCQACKIRTALRLHDEENGWQVHPFCNQCLKSPVCLNCKVNRKNEGYEFCSRECGRKVWGLPLREPGMDERLMCKFCHQNPRNPGYDYCTPLCSQAAERQRRLDETKARLPPTPIPPTTFKFVDVDSKARLPPAPIPPTTRVEAKSKAYPPPTPYPRNFKFPSEEPSTQEPSAQKKPKAKPNLRIITSAQSSGTPPSVIPVQPLVTKPVHSGAGIVRSHSTQPLASAAVNDGFDLVRPHSTRPSASEAVHGAFGSVRSYSTQPLASQFGPMCVYCHAVPADAFRSGLDGFCSKTCLRSWRRLAEISMQICPACMIDPKFRYPCKSRCDQEAKDAYIRVREDTKALSKKDERCLACFVYPVSRDDPICKHCLPSIMPHRGSKRVLVPEHHIVFKSTEKDFRKYWDCNLTGRRPQLQNVWAIVCDERKTDSYERYKRNVAASASDRKAHEKHLWFGTFRHCASSTVSCCDSPSCFMCSMMRNASKDTLKLLMKGHSLAQFGGGFYTARAPSTAHIRLEGPSTSRECGIILAEVVTGRHYEVKADFPEIKSAPTGYDSVHTLQTIEPTGKKVQDSHYVIYKPEAIKPALFVVYKH